MAAAISNPVATTAGSIGVGLGGLGVLGSLFGGAVSPVTNPYAAQSDNGYGQEEANGANESEYGQGQLGVANTLQGTETGALNNLLTDVSNPTTGLTSTQMEALDNQSNNTGEFEGANANLISSLGARGIVSPQGASSELSGGQSDLAGQKAASTANINNTNTWDMLRSHLNNLMTANDAVKGAQEQASSEGTGAMTSGGELSANAGNDYLNQGQQQIQDTQTAQQGQNQGFGSISSFGGSLAGLGSIF